MAKKRYKFEMFAKDFNSPLKRNFIFTKAFFKCPTLLKLPRFVIGIVSKKNSIEYFYDLSTWANTHEAIKAKALKDSNYVDKLIDSFLKLGRKMNQWSEKAVFKKDLTKVSNSALYQLVEKFIDYQSSMYAIGVMMPVLDFLSFSYVESNLRKFLKDKLPVKDFDQYFKVFTYPSHDSFALKQEIDLLRMISKYIKIKGWSQAVINQDMDYLKNKFPKFFNDLKKHSIKHGWVYYVYMGPAFGPGEFLEFIRDYLRKKVKPQTRIKQILDERKAIEKQRVACLKKLKPDSFYLSILRLAPKMVWAKPARKDLQSKTYYHLEKLYREIGKRLNISLNQAQSIPPVDLRNYLVKGRRVDINKINQIYNFHICRPNDDGTVSVLFGQQAVRFFKTLKQNKVEFDKEIKEIKGTCAFAGQAKGKVKIINQPSDMVKMNNGDVLVSVATTPSIVPAMKKATAIITDEGGLTCHASIVSRELQIPCVVGTGFITRLVKDGDKIEVDATRGIVRKI
jgi:phosphohistidine swiveling domain-containing protein